MGRTQGTGTPSANICRPLARPIQVGHPRTWPSSSVVPHRTPPPNSWAVALLFALCAEYLQAIALRIKVQPDTKLPSGRPGTGCWDESDGEAQVLQRRDEARAT